MRLLRNNPRLDVNLRTSRFTCAPPPPQGARLRRHRRGGPVQPPGQEGGPPEPQPHQHAQLLQLQQQHGQPEQPPAAGAGRLQRPRVRLRVSQSQQSLFTFAAFPPPTESGLFLRPQEPERSVRGNAEVRERASDWTRLSSPVGALGPTGQVPPMMFFFFELANRLGL